MRYFSGDVTDMPKTGGRSFNKLMTNVVYAWLMCSCVFGVIASLLYIQKQHSSKQHLQDIVHKVQFELNSQIQAVDEFLLEAEKIDTTCTPDTLKILRQHVFKNPAVSEIGIVNSAGLLACNSFGVVAPAIQTTEPVKALGLRYHGPIISDYLEMSAFVLARTRKDGYEVNVLMPSTWLRGSLNLAQYSQFDFVALVDAKTGVPIILHGLYSLPLNKKLFPLNHMYTGSEKFDDGAEKYFMTTPLSALPELALIVSSNTVQFDDLNPQLLSMFILLYVAMWLCVCVLLNYYDKRQLGLKQQLKRALLKKELFNVYQPLIDAMSDRIIGVEVLIRWQHPVEGELSPALFIPEAERSGAIVDISIAQIKQAIIELRPILAAQPKFKVSFNVNGRLLTDSRYLEVLRQACRDISTLTIELTERDVLSQERVKKILEMIKGWGVEIAIDDFGTGYSGLHYLQSFSIDLLKIDQSFVASIGLDNLQSPVLNAMIDMAGNLNKKLIAEGVETNTQAQYLLAHGVTIHQGWFYAKAQNIARLREIILKQTLAWQTQSKAG
ncbi:EAL domain-containing protein [Pseudoalteromonas sp. MMG012]|uniref:EAL domain-containing protein n=1 Tax=Pseudoalteromonas sp. MMG012 TaxID=2822686 RepID=UPI001FFD7210|nr:EAL domain-containing protein [Pseudoalteromonas sp. MMG012]